MIHPMSPPHTFAVLAILASLGAAPALREGDVILLEPYETVTVAAGSQNAFRFQSLADIDPIHPLAGEPDTQTLSLFGREDLIEAISEDYRATECAPLHGAGDVTVEIVRKARKTSVVIINESHERSEHRGFTAALLGRLRSEGYAALAMEALSNPPFNVPLRYQPSVVQEPGLAYLLDKDGYLLGEAAFGRLGRAAKRLSYVLVPYEPQEDGTRGAMSRAKQIALREEGQASALAAWIKKHPGLKLIVHVGYSHAIDVPRADGTRWMAMRLRAKTGIDPLTISQTTCRGGAPSRRLAVLPDEMPAGTFDLIVDHPTAHFVHGRPAWRMMAGDVPVTIPAALRPERGWRVIEARLEGDSPASVPMDRVAIRSGEDIALMLPPGRYRLRVLDPSSIPSPND